MTKIEVKDGEALMYKTSVQLAIESNLLYDLIARIAKYNVEDLNRLLELERELTHQETA